jgi:hypothetical protein
MEREPVDPRRVAVVVVHGVADQVAGETARSVAELLVASAPHGAAYEARATDSFVLAVDPLRPATAAPRESPPTPTGKTRPLFKAFVQSARSDFQRPGWEAPATRAQAQSQANAAGPGPKTRPGFAKAAAAPTAAAPDDRGIAATNYLLGKYIENGAAPEAFDSTCIELERTAAGGRERVDVYEMYWADLSRLSGAIPRIVTELFTMVFRLSKLGRETVDEARLQLRGADGKAPASWRWLANTQIALDWAFVNGLAALFAQLGLLAIVVVAFGFAAPFEPVLGKVVGIAALFFGALWFAYRRRDTRQRWIAPLALVAAALVMLLLPASAFWILALLFLVLLTLGYDAALRVADDRFPLTRVVGLVFWGAVLALMLGAAVWRVGWHRESASLAIWVQTALLGTEVALYAIKAWWILAAPLFIAWFVSGVAAARQGGYQGAASVGTGRLGFFVSLGAFVMLTMASWALISNLLELSVERVGYVPAIFSLGEVTSGHSDASLAAASCAWNGASVAATFVAPANPPSTAELFLGARYEDSTSFFSLVAALLLLLVLYLAAMFLPSLLAELKLLASNPAGDPGGARRLGRWLTAGYRRLDGTVLVVVVVATVIATAVGYVLTFGRGGPLQDAASTSVMNCVAYVSQSALKPLVLSAAGIAAALAALGGVLSRYVPGLRAPLDIALDVDNYFREFPRRSIPRARIFSRYAALLDHIAAQGYGRVVIVAHSQGTVISAELLRFLSDAAPGAPDRGGRAERLRRRIGSDVRLLTLGCPLRQLYAARFPSLYGWVLAAHETGNGPRASDIGVERWANAFTSGDYVGRWLWSSPRIAGDALGQPMVDTLHPPSFGRTDAYSAFDPMPPALHPFSMVRELEVCLGAGAHTHYFEPDQANVAWLIDHLVASPPLRPVGDGANARGSVAAA